MPKLNVQQSNQNIIQAFRNALAIGNLKGIIASDGNHNFSTAGSNRNLLDNPWWGLNEVINQRGNTSGQTTHNAYSIDRWKMSYGSAPGTWSIAADGITITAASGTYALFQQPLANPSALLGKTVTCSIWFADGTIASGTVENITWTENPVVFTYRYARIQLLNEGVFRVTVLSGGSETIRAVKLELGSVSTLANDTPPNYAEELAKCKYYCRVVDFDTDVSVGIGWAFSNSGAVIPNIFGFGNEMRAVPTVTSTGSFVLRTTGGANINVTSFAIGASVKDAISLNASVASGLTANQPVRLQAGTGAKLVFSADL